jgi:hypothetical protein
VRVQRLFTTFPDGAPGFGLLLLRFAVAGVLAHHAAMSLSDVALTGAWIVGILTAVTAALIGVGFLTPLGGVAGAAIVAGLALSVLPAPPRNVVGLGMTAFAMVLAAAALAFIGPGAFSVDAALFGRREITIPPHMDEG